MLLQIENGLTRITEITTGLTNYILKVGPGLLLALVVLFAGLRLIRWSVKLFGSVFEKHKVDPTLRPFFSNLIKWLLTAILFISVASMIGIETTSFVAVLGAAGLAVGLALQGTLQNFAGGVMLLLFKPFKVGDYIEANGFNGLVEEIQIFVTQIVTAQNEVVYIPNGLMANANVKNQSGKAHIRVDMFVSVGAGADVEEVRSILNNILASDQDIIRTPEQVVSIYKFTSDAIEFAVWPYASRENYWKVWFRTQELMKKELDRAGIPGPLQDLKIIMDQPLVK